MGGFPSGPDPYLVYGLPWLAVSSNRLFFKNGRRLKWFKWLFWFKLFGPRWPGFAAQGARVWGVESRIVGIWRFWDRVGGMGFAGDLDRFQKTWILVLLAVLRFFFFEFKGGLESGWISDRVQPAFRLWFALVGRFVDPNLFQKRPAIEMIEMIKMI